MSVSLVVDALFVKIFQVVNQKIKINKIENQIRGDKFDYLYYRDILKQYSPAILAYAHKKNIKIDDIIVATLLDLEKRNKIEIENGNIIIDKNIEELDITKCEKQILLYCNQQQEVDVNVLKKELYQEIENETQRKGLVYVENEKNFNSTYIMEFFMVWLILYILATIVFFIQTSNLGIVLLVFYFLVFLCIPMYKMIQSKIKVIVRTLKGIEIAAKLNGLKRYIEEYSNIQNDSIRNIELFEDYVIYAIICDLPGKLNKEVKELYIKLSKK